jgi:hypothetical protein
MREVDKMRVNWARLEKFKYPLMILALGLVLLLLPGTSGEKGGARDGDLRLQEILAATKGVGDAKVLLSDKGVIVVCDGADNPQTRLDILRAVGSYTGFGSDKITILKSAEQG